MIVSRKIQPIEGQFKASIEVKRPDKRRRDIDGFAKATLDMLESAGVIENDCLCVEITSRWVNEGPDMVVKLEKVSEFT